MRRTITQPGPGTYTTRRDVTLPTLPELKQAAVAVCVTQRERTPALLLTRRAAQLRTHAGQWALPGGRRDDGETAVQGRAA
jgi:8-oxo-dGTP pyrophosphatase MutT (NUDIX family)